MAGEDADPRRTFSTRDVSLRTDAGKLGVPFLSFRREDGNLVVVSLAPGRDLFTIGRDKSCDVSLPWDRRVSKAHAELRRFGDSDTWLVEDDGLSRNGTFVNTERVVARRRLEKGDMLRVGETRIAYEEPSFDRKSEGTHQDGGVIREPTPAQRRVLVELCRPRRDGPAAPASTAQIAAALVVDESTVKTHLKALYALFDLGEVPRGQKRAQLMETALIQGYIRPEEL